MTKFWRFWQFWRRLGGALKRVDWAQLAELAVLAAVLAIAALVSYTHLRSVWTHAGAPWANLGPLTVDGLFAAAWLRMSRRRRDGVAVGFLAWLALGVALLATLAGNLAAAWIDRLMSPDHIDGLALVVAGWPAVAFALVWELVTGHGQKATASSVATSITSTTPDDASSVATSITSTTPDDASNAPVRPPAPTSLAVVPGDDAEVEARKLAADGAGRTKLVALGLTHHRAKQILKEVRQPDRQDAADQVAV